MPVTYLGGWIFEGGEAKRGYLRVEDGSVAEVCSGTIPGDAERALVIPSFVNAHTHIGDSLAYPAPAGSLEEIVAPPSGYKHRVLRSASRSAKIDAMRQAIQLMSRTGTSDFVDFREEGLEGVQALQEALTPESPRVTILGRPPSSESGPSEVEALLERCNGIGMSAVRDWEFSLLSMLSSRAKAAGKKFSIHASEGEREDIQKVLELEPDFVVHMSTATTDDLTACASSNVPVVVCARSNMFFGIRPDFGRYAKSGVDIALGTDNGMIARPDMMEELKAAFQLAHAHFGPPAVIRMATTGGRKVLNAKAKITTEISAEADLTVVRVRGDDPLKSLVTESSWRDVQAVVRGGKVRRSETWRT